MIALWVQNRQLHRVQNGISLLIIANTFFSPTLVQVLVYHIFIMATFYHTMCVVLYLVCSVCTVSFITIKCQEHLLHVASLVPALSRGKGFSEKLGLRNL